KQVTTADDADVGKLSALAARAFAWKAVPPTSLTALAEAVAPLCAVLRGEVRGQLNDHGSQVWKAAHELRSALFPEQSDDQVADAIAQLCTYSMLLDELFRGWVVVKA
ncbi:MAG TPA: hypothetical protein VNT55_05625, partial [Baekduia sp.]|nr:hypothetical protein [Baekduia sp.]